MKDPTATMCAARDCVEPREPGTFYCARHSASVGKGEVKRVKALIEGRRARGNITVVFVLGLVVTFVGVVIAAAADVTYEVTDAGLVQGGNAAGYALGLFVAAVGSMMAFIAVVAWGVMMGIRAAGK